MPFRWACSPRTPSGPAESNGDGRCFRGDAKETYIGPLPSQCECGTPHGANYTRSKGHESLLTPDFIMFLTGKGLSLTKTLREAGLLRTGNKKACYSDSDEDTWLDECAEFGIDEKEDADRLTGDPGNTDLPGTTDLTHAQPIQKNTNVDAENHKDTETNIDIENCEDIEDQVAKGSRTAKEYQSKPLAITQTIKEDGLVKQ